MIITTTVKMILLMMMNHVWFQDGDYEPVESLPYFHSCLSKEEAVEKLMLGMFWMYMILIVKKKSIDGG